MKNRIGIVGGGQLGRMLAFEAKKLGFYVTVLDPTSQSPAGQVADWQIVSDFQSEKAIEELAAVSDFLTFEIELANSKILEKLSKNGLAVNPSAKTLSVIKDKLVQKQFLKKAQVPVADFLEIKSLDPKVIKEEIKQAVKKFGFPMLLKARFDGYDGRGNALIKNKSDIDRAIYKLRGKKLYIEKFVPFLSELAIMVARSTKGEITTYPVTRTIHKNNICHIVFAPASISKTVEKKAKDLAVKVMKKLKGAGVFAVEMFLTKDNSVLANEIAPRVHNSGHYTIESCVTSQFEQHVRAITGLPLGKTDMLVNSAVMVNILGDRQGKAELFGVEKALSLPNVSVHVYGKMETRIERKMGHITAIGDNMMECLKRAKKARRYITI